MPYNESLAERIRLQIGDAPDFSEKKMFGGLSFLYKNKMTIGVMNDDLMVRVLSEKMETVLAEAHCSPMVFTGKPMKEFVTVAPDGTITDQQITRWIALGTEHAKWKLGE